MCFVMRHCAFAPTSFRRSRETAYIFEVYPARQCHVNGISWSGASTEYSRNGLLSVFHANLTYRTDRPVLEHDQNFAGRMS